MNRSSGLFKSGRGFVPLFAIVFALMVSLSITSVAQAATITVCASGCDHATIQAALAVAQPGDIVQLSDGTYVVGTSLVVPTGVTLQGTSEANTIIDTTSIGSGYGIQSTGTANIAFRNFTLLGPPSAPNGYGIKLAGNSGGVVNRLDGVVIENVTVIGSGRSEIDLNGVNNATLTNITVDGINGAGGVGLALGSVNNVTVENITTLNNQWGGIGIFTESSQGGSTDNVSIIGTNSFGEDNPMYVQVKNGIPMGNLVAPDFTHTLRNPAHRSNGAEFTFYQLSESAAISLALALQQATAPANTESTIRTIADGSFVVGSDGTTSMSIQSAVDAATAGDTINVSAGTYQEQVIINKSLTLSGSSSPTIIAPISPAQFKIPGSTRSWQPVIFAYGGSNDGSGNISGGDTIAVSVSGLKVDGDNRGGGSAAGILFRNVNPGTVSNNTVQNMSISVQETFGIIVYGDSSVTISGNNVSGYARGGISANGDIGPATDPYAIIEDNTVSGPGVGAPVTWAPNGIQIGWGASGIIRRNTVTGNGWPGDAWSGTGILVAASNVLVTDNNVTQNESGIATIGDVFFGSNAFASATILNNTVQNNTYGISIQDRSQNTKIIGNVVSNNEKDGISVVDFGGSYASHPGPTGTLVYFNKVVGNNTSDDAESGGLFVNIAETLDARNNWWGNSSGPSGSVQDADTGLEATGSGDAIVNDGAAMRFDPWLGADLEEVAFGELGLTDSLSGPGNSSATNTTPSGPSNFLVILSKFAGNPTSAPNFAAAGNYFDIFVSGATTTDSLEVVLPADGDGNLYYYNGTAWAPVLENGVPVTPSNNLYTFTLDDNSTPKLTALNETPFAGAGNEEIRISTPNNTVSAGQTFQVVVEAGSDALFGVDVSMTFDADELEVTSIALGNGLQPGTIAVNTYDNTPPGTLQFAYSQLGSSEANVSGTNLMLATITFLAHTAGDTSVTLGNALFTDKDGNPATPAPLDSPINLTVNPSPSVYVDVALQGRSDHAGLELQVSPVGPGNVLYDNTVVAGKLQIPTVPSGTYEARVSAPKYLAAIQTFTVSTQSEYDLNGVNGASPSGLILALRGGDINGDDQINIQDLVLIGVVFGDNTPSSDINGDGVVNIQDLAIAAGNFDLETGVDDYPDYPNNLWD